MHSKKIAPGFKANVLFVSVVFLVWRLFTFAVAALGTNFLDFKASFPYSDTVLALSGLPQWLWHWGNFDGVHYLTIAHTGYDGFGTQVFFPLYPILISFLSKVTGNDLISGLLISNIALFFSALLLFNFVEKHFDTTTAKWSVIFLFAFPTSFFLGAVYPESLLLLLILLSFTTKNIWAGLFAGLASGTKLIGLFLAPILVLFKPRNIWGAFGVSGFALFVLYLWTKFNNPLIFMSAQSAFGNNRASDLTSLVLPPQVIFRYLKIFITGHWQHLDIWIALLEFCAVVCSSVVLLILTKRKTFSLQILVFSWLALLLPTFSGTLSSMPRYLLPIFPIFIFLATIKSQQLRSGILAVFVLLLALLTVLYTRGFFVA